MQGRDQTLVVPNASTRRYVEDLREPSALHLMPTGGASLARLLHPPYDTSAEGIMDASREIAKRVVWSGLRHLPLRQRRQILYRRHHGRWPKLGATSELFTEKMQYRILFDRRALIGDLGDKLGMKDRAAQLADVRIPRTYWCGINLDELASLPDLPSRWELKPNNATGKVILGEG